MLHGSAKRLSKREGKEEALVGNAVLAAASAIISDTEMLHQVEGILKLRIANGSRVLSPHESRYRVGISEREV